MELIELWTLQDVGALERIKQTEVLKCDGRKIDHPDFRKSYQWLIKQMQDRINGYPKGRYPIWAWPTKPDMRTSKHRFWGKDPIVRIGFRVPRERVLFHDFYEWHCVLNRMPVTLSEAEWDESESWTREQIEESWVRIFDPNLLKTADPEWIGSGPPDFQVTLAEVHANEIFSTKIYQPRPKPKWLG